MRHPNLSNALLGLWNRARSSVLWFPRSWTPACGGAASADCDYGPQSAADRGGGLISHGRSAVDAVSVGREISELTSGATSLTYVIDVPFGKILKQLRAALKAEGLQIPMEMDVSGRIRNELGVALKPCRILYIDCPFLLLEAAIVNASAAALVPLQVVVAEAGSRSVIHLVARTDRAVTSGLRAQFERLFSRVLAVLRDLRAQRTVHELAF